MNKLSKIINSLSEEDLLKIKRDLVSGNIDKLIEQKLCQIQKTQFSSKQCPVCGAEINSESLSLEFGQAYLRRRAFFDGVDCLEYFVNTQLKKSISQVHEVDE